MKNMTNEKGHMGFVNCRKRVLLISFILTCVTGDVTVEQQQIKASEGSSATLKCFVCSDHEPSLSWFYNNNKINTKQVVVEEGKVVHKYILSNTTNQNSKPTRSYNLQIRNVLSTDDGVYTCLVIVAGNTIKGNITLAVKYLNEKPFVNCQLLLSTPSRPSLTEHGNNHEIGKTRDQTQTLISVKANIGKNILVNITIMKSAHHKHEIDVHFATEEQSNAVDGLDVSYLVNVTGLDGWKFWCVAHQSMMLRPVNSSTPLLMKPRVNITKLKKDSVQYKCDVESYPEVTFFRWIVCGNEIESVQSKCKELNSTRSNVTLMDIGSENDVLILICEAQNAVGSGHGNLTITKHTEHTDMPITRQIEPTDITRHNTPTKNKTRRGLVIWCIGGGFVFLFSLAIPIVCLYFRKQSRFINKNVEISDTDKKVEAMRTFL
ncbi:uncharacterized protein LOC117117275 [Anneissia japonica]|uniref:uncharacterized protein LOC117117275 n=1 Tax=Anneissia japonica TaxID=1529436 RepID=UPI0014259EB0|nr:uncharacterized protein LOC117117275 [Anneissia japonica]XP_033117423.1 uncharacterized protein LOC117117275 [Anneissia japonica]XP_033117424.1 uncharacterized protein LOC117117275 [Anneissia japonica]